MCVCVYNIAQCSAHSSEWATTTTTTTTEYYYYITILLLLNTNPTTHTNRAGETVHRNSENACTMPSGECIKGGEIKRRKRERGEETPRRRCGAAAHAASQCCVYICCIYV